MSDLPPIPKDHDYMRDLRSCLAGSPHIATLVGLMQGQSVRFVYLDSATPHGIPWGAIVVQGEPDVTVLRAVAASVEKALDDDRVRLREQTLKQ